jgi:cbb3-type cytochrome oxidase subunit 3
MNLITLARASITIVWFALFVAIWISAWSRGRRDAYAAAAQLPLENSISTPTSNEVRT